jgi:hypothetical protein
MNAMSPHEGTPGSQMLNGTRGQSGKAATAKRRGLSRAPLRAFFGYLLLTLILTYPLILYMTSHIPGGNVDEGAFLWNTWWMKYALLDLHTNPLSTNMIFHPLGVNLALYTLTPLQGVLALPLTLAAGPIVATNVLFILAFALSGLGAYLLALDVLWTSASAADAPGRLRLAAFVAGALFAFASGRFLYAALGQYDYVHVQWLPLTVLFLLRTLRSSGWRAPVLAGIFAACAGLTEMNFVVFLAIFVLVWLAYLLARRRSLLLERGALGRLVLALVVFVVGFGPLGLAVVREMAHAGDYMVRGWGGADRFLVDALGPLVPSPLHSLAGDWAQAAARNFSDINFGFVGYAALLLAALGVLAGRGRAGARFWLLTTIAFFVLALGPLLHINGQSQFEVDGLPVNLPLPYIVLHYLPILNGARVPGRFAIMATLALSVLVALGALALLRRVRRPGLLAAVLVVLIVAGNISVPLPLVNAVAPEPYQRIAADPGDFAILQIPLGWRDGFGTVGRERTILQSYQSVHGKRIIGGNTSRSPDYLLPYFANLPVLRSIVALEEGRSLAAGVVEADRAQAGALLSFLNVHYIVVHGDYVGGPVDQYVQSALPVTRLAGEAGIVENAVWRFAPSGKRVETATENAGWVLYAVDNVHESVGTVVDVGAPAAQMHLAAGWSRAETMGDLTFCWVEERQALALMQIEQPRAATLTVRAAPFSYDGAPQQQMTVAVNGRTVGTVALASGWQEYAVSVPASALGSGANQIWLQFAHVVSPAEVLGSDDRRTLAAAVDWLSLE